METIFLNAAGTVQFVRNDMEQGNWTQEEYTVNATFPYVEGKVITRGMRLAFRDPATNTLEMFEIRNVTNIEPDHYQQLIAEHIAVSELTDDHINSAEITDKTAAQALGTVLTGTLWSVGNSTVSAQSSVDISRGSVWQAVIAIGTNWNAYITPRVTVNAAGSITGRYLDISPAQGTWRGVRLSIDKNMSDSSVIYDDSDVLTALYGYGGNVDKPQQSGDDKTEELTFADVVWSATSEHPAKPSGQTYLEDPAKTALYGRNGRPRYGYYQNGDIKDANILLEKTWEALKQTSDPKISISGTVVDLYRLGYKDQPLRLHDTVIVEIRQTGETFEKEIIRLDVDLIDPSATRPEIGDYIQNIIYINRETNTRASGGGGGGGRGQTNLEDDDSKTYSAYVKTNDMIGMVVGMKNGGYYIKGGEITLAINEDGGTTATIDADVINLGDVATAFKDYGLECGDLTCYGDIDLDQDLTAGGTVSGLYGSFTNGISIGASGVLDCYDIDCADISCSKLASTGDVSGSSLTTTGTVSGGEVHVPDAKLKVGSSYASWQTYSARHCNLSSAKHFMYSNSSGGTQDGTIAGRVVSSYTDVTLHYLGSAST